MKTCSSCDTASPWVQRFAPLIPGGEVLDLACGAGRHAKLLASLGHAVVALDRDSEALAKISDPRIVCMLADLELSTSGDDPWPFEMDRFAAIVVTNYLYRRLFPNIIASIMPNGVLIYETFAVGNEKFGKPVNPDFLLAPGELLELVRQKGMPATRILAFEEGYTERPNPSMVQRICAIKADACVPQQRFRLN